MSQFIEQLICSNTQIRCEERERERERETDEIRVEERETDEIRVEERETARASSGTEARVDGGIVVEISGP